MVVTEPRPVQLPVSRHRIRHLVTILSPDAEPSRWRCEPAMWTVVVGGRERGRCIHHCQLLYLRPALRHLSPLPSDAPYYGDRHPTADTRPTLPRTPPFVHRFLPPTARIQRASHPPHARLGVLQCADRPRLGPDLIKSLRLGCAEDHTAPYHPPRRLSRARQRRAHRNVVRPHDRVAVQMGDRRRRRVRGRCLGFGGGSERRRWRWHRAEPHRDGAR